MVLLVPASRLDRAFWQSHVEVPTGGGTRRARCGKYLTRAPYRQVQLAGDGSRRELAARLRLCPACARWLDE